MLVAAAVCPHPPLLIHATTGGADPVALGGRADTRGSADSAVDDEVTRLRRACAVAVARLLAAGPDLVIVIGGADRSAAYPADAAGSLRCYGIPFRTGVGEPVLPLSLTVGAWLLRACEAGPPPITQVHGVWHALPPPQCLALGARLASRGPRVGMLVMGDGPARRATGLHGAPDPDADAYDKEVAASFAAADADRLAALDPAWDDKLLVAGRAAWQTLAGATRGCELSGQLLFADAPLDVSYVVATWEIGG